MDVSPVFSEAFLANNTPNDPEELDIDCDGLGDLQTGWAIIDGLVATSSAQTIQDPALLGTISGGTTPAIDGAHLLWESGRQDNGDFLGFGGLNSEADP